MRLSAIALPVALLIAPALLGAQSFSTVEERMSAAEFREAGLDTLSDAQLQALNAWLQREGCRSNAAAASAASTADRRGFRAEATDDDADVVSRLPGAFTGWNGGELIKLENGQVWRSIDSGSALRGVNLQNPQVTIRKGVFGSWWLKVEGYNTSIKVERVE